MTDIRVQSLASTREVFPRYTESGPVMGMTIGNMVADLYERAEFLGVDLDVASLTVKVVPQEFPGEDGRTTHKIVAQVEGLPR